MVRYPAANAMASFIDAPDLFTEQGLMVMQPLMGLRLF